MCPRSTWAVIEELILLFWLFLEVRLLSEVVEQYGKEKKV